MTAPRPSPTAALPEGQESALDLARDRFEGDELAIVLSHYDLPVIRRIRVYKRGSRRSPKVRIDTDVQRYLLKRRAVGRRDARRVELAHSLHARLEEARYPVPGLMRTRSHDATALELRGRVYELFEYIQGERDNGSTAAAVAAGTALGAFHEILADRAPSETPEGARTTSFHAAPTVDAMLRQAPAMITEANADTELDELRTLCGRLGDAYAAATERVAELGFDDLPPRVLHGDWHPGNLLYRDGAIVGVLDFDSVREEPRIIDLANAALQFSMVMPENRDPRDWPEKFGARRIGAMIRGYGGGTRHALDRRELEMIPWLMIEALVIEALIPIAATGRFARLDGAAFLVMVDRKLAWLAPRASQLIEHLRERPS